MMHGKDIMHGRKNELKEIDRPKIYPQYHLPFRPINILTFRNPLIQNLKRGRRRKPRSTVFSLEVSEVAKVGVTPLFTCSQSSLTSIKTMCQSLPSTKNLLIRQRKKNHAPQLMPSTKLRECGEK
jgi:hypothetical protein